jgi:hypothetical protein
VPFSDREVFWERFAFIFQIDINNCEIGEACSAYGEGEAYTEFWWGNPKERDNLGDSGVDGSIILRWVFRKWDVGVCNASSWLRIGTGRGHL